MGSNVVGFGALVLCALPALAAPDPAAAARLAQQIGRPTTSYLQLKDVAARFAQVADHPTRLFAPGGPPLGVYLNRFATRYTCGDDNAAQNVSSVVCGASPADVGGWSYSNASWDQMKGCVTDMFAQFNLFVTDVEPTSGDYVEAMVGGSPDEAGMPQGVGGVAPFSCGLIPGAVVYAFADVYGNDPQGICETVAQEVAHAFGLDHELLCEDPMTYLSGCGAKTFQDNYASCGEFEPRECSCNIPSQNSVQMMLETLGASDGSPPPPPPDDNEIPVATLVSPADQQVLLSNSVISIVAEVSDDTALSIVELEWDFTSETMFCPGANGAWECSITGTTATWNIQVGEGARSYRVHVRDLVGNEVTTPDRTIFLTADGQTPPDDAIAPTVLVLSPINAAVLAANSQLEIIALVADNDGLSRVELNWPFRGEVYPCPLQTDGVSCTIDGDVATWLLQVGEGDRGFSVRVTDRAGNTTTSPEQNITLVNGVTPPTDGNTLPGDAVTLACGETVSVAGVDGDWVVVTAPDGDVVTVSAAGAGATLVATHDGTEVLADGTGSVQYTSTGATQIAIVPDSSGGGALAVSAACTSKQADAPRNKLGRTPTQGTCAQWGSTAPLLGVVLLALRRRRLTR